MGRPISKRKIGLGTGRIRVTSYKFASGSEAQSPIGYIVKQRSTNKFIISNGVKTEICTLVNKNRGALAASEFCIYAVLDDSTIVQVTKLRDRTIQYEGGTGNVNNIKYVIAPDKPNLTTDGYAQVDGQS